MKYIVDTNVPLKASNIHVADPLDAKCALSCLLFIQTLMESSDMLVIDADGEIYREYANNFMTYGQDSVASQFLKWVQRHLTLREGSHIEPHKIHRMSYGVYIEFPDSLQLKGFDVADKKFIALSNSHPEHPIIVEGSDSLWWKYRTALNDLGIHIEFLCEEYVKTKFEESFNA